MRETPRISAVKKEKLASTEQETIGQIDAYLARGDFDSIGDLPGYAIIERHDGFPDCIMYSMPEFNWRYEMIEDFLEREYVETTERVPGNLVIYFSGKYPSHAGILQSDTKVRSKFGFGHVYDHPITVVPSMYGTARFFRKKS